MTVALKAHYAMVAAHPPVEKTTYEKTKPINVPMIANGAVQGYVVAEFSYTAELEEGLISKPPIEAFILDEAFKKLYADEKLDFRHLEKYDFAALTKDLIVRVNARLSKPVLKDVLVEEFNYISREEVSK
jgi:hypothetical protein